MKMKKKLLTMMLISALALALAGCGGSGDDTAEDAADDPASETYTINYNANSNGQEMPEYQFINGNMKGFLNSEARLNMDISLTLNGDGTYSLTAEGYTKEGEERLEIGGGSGIGLVLETNAEGTYVENEDGTITISKASHVDYQLDYETYSEELSNMIGLSIESDGSAGEWNSDNNPELLEMVPETIFTLGEDNTIVTYALANADASSDDNTEDGDSNDAQSSTEGDSLLTITSEDGATTFTFNKDGTYAFFFESYNITDTGSYTYDQAASSLTITDANGTETIAAAENGSIPLHYAASQSEELTGDFIIPVADLESALSAQ